MNAKCNLVTVLLLCCLIFPGNAQEFNWQDLVNRWPERLRTWARRKTLSGISTRY